MHLRWRVLRLLAESSQRIMDAVYLESGSAASRCRATLSSGTLTSLPRDGGDLDDRRPDDFELDACLFEALCGVPADRDGSLAPTSPNRLPT
mmetsp:Transcript_7550/g.15671  ORF Transcript_7550/g.15671 Transcript_7550/m.15671 type:complete len:92 (-) Transcript_7550:256-531(-)